MASVKLVDVNKSFDGNNMVVNGVNFSIGDGDFLVIVGPSGCGKSTTLNLIAGLDEVTSGQIYINDQLVNGVEPKDRNVSMVFQSHTLYPHLTVYGNLAFSLKAKHIKKSIIEEKVSQVARMLDIEGLLKRKPHQLSGGQQQRVAIGRAIIREPAVFLMDEPLSNLDVNLRVNMRKEIKHIHEDLNATFIYVTHAQTEAMTLATSLVVMNEGVIQQLGTPFDVFMRPQNTFVAKFMGAHPINLLRSEISFLDLNQTLNIDLFGIRISGTCRKDAIDSTLSVDVGIRPEGFDLVETSEGICFSVKHSEILGMETLYVCEVDDKEVAVILPTELNQRKTLYLRPKLSMVSVFSSETGRRIDFDTPLKFNNINKEE